MPHPTPSTIAAILTAALLSTTLALAQAEPHPASSAPENDWTRAPIAPKHNLIVVTLAEPTHRHTCRVQSFTPDQLVCKGSFGKAHTYRPQEIAALIRPGDNNLGLKLFLGFNGALGAATWGTIILVATCIPCAAATAVAALFFFSAAGAMAYGDPQSDALLYLAPGQTLRVKLRD